MLVQAIHEPIASAVDGGSVSTSASDNIAARVNNSTTFIYYLALVRPCLAIVATVIHAAFPVHATDAAEIDEIHLVDGLNAVLFLLLIASAVRDLMSEITYAVSVQYQFGGFSTR